MPRVTSEEKPRRDASVIADRARGFGWTAIAARHDLCERMCREIWNEHLRKQPLGPDDPREALREAVARYDAAIEDLARLAESTGNDPVRLGSIKARLDAMTRREDLLRIAGILPSTARALRTEIDIQKMTDVIIDLFDRVVPESLRDQAELDLIAALEAA
ncbi:MAG: hypothetical protein ACR2GT_01215 [Gaiellaceae bacterium]